MDCEFSLFVYKGAESSDYMLGLGIDGKQIFGGDVTDTFGDKYISEIARLKYPHGKEANYVATLINGEPEPVYSMPLSEAEFEQVLEAYEKA